MEVDEAIKGCDDRRLRAKYSSAIYVIQRALALYRTDELAFSFNGGKDSTVLLHLLRAAYFLHEKERKQSNGNLVDNGYTFSMRTIYFERPSTFPEINSFTHETATTYRLHLDVITQDFKSGLEALLKSNPIRAIFLGVRTGDPTAVGQEQFSPTSPGWPPFMRVNPILDWSYRDVWAFLLKCKAPYCSLYDQGYTSIGSIHDTVPNSQLRISNPTTSQENYRPAYLLSDGRLERAGRAKKPLEVHGNVRLSNGLESLDTQHISVPKASVIGVGDEILFGAVEDFLGPLLCKKLHSIGWSVTKLDIVQSDVDSVAEAVERQKSENDMVFVYGGVGHMQSDATLSGVAKAFGVRLAPVEEFEEHINCIESHNGMAQLPEGITELLHHANLPVPLMKCQNVIIFGACNPSELNNEWKCLMEPAKSRMELAKSRGFLKLAEPFVSKCLTTKLSDREAAQPLLALHAQFPDIFISCYRKSRKGPLVIFIEGKDQARVKSAMEAFRPKFQPQPGLLDCFRKNH